MYSSYGPFSLRLSTSQILCGGDSLKEELHRTTSPSNGPSGQSESRKKYSSSFNWKVTTSKGMEPTPEELEILDEFWDNFLCVYNTKVKEGQIQEIKTKEHRYAVFQLLWLYKDKIKKNPQGKEELLRELEIQIERSSLMFDEYYVWRESSVLIDKLVRAKYKRERPNIFGTEVPVDDVRYTPNIPVEGNVNDEYTDEELLNVANAKEYVLFRLRSQQDIGVLNSLGHFTVECILVHVLGQLYNNPSSVGSHLVPLAKLIEKLDTTVRSVANEMQHTSPYGVNESVVAPQASISESEEASLDAIKRNQDRSKKRVSNQKGCNTNFSKLSDKQSKYSCTNYAIGVALLEFLLQKDILTVQNQNDDNNGHVLIKTKRSRYYKPMPLYVSLNFDRNLLPIRVCLPMVFRPRKVDLCEESHGDRINVEQPSYILRGGYLQNVSKDIIECARLLSTPNMFHYDVRFQNVEHAIQLVEVMNASQEVPYRINHPWLKTIRNDYDLLVQAGLLSPKKLATMELISACDILRGSYIKNKRIQKLYSYNDLLSTFTRNIQKARYERFIIELAEALDGYEIYFPVYLDFLGRIHRPGIFNFHECDLASALLQFVPEHTNDTSPIKGELAGLTSKEVETIHIATGFHMKKFQNSEEASKWYSETKDDISKMLADNKLRLYLLTAREARRPFQFLANITILQSVQWKDWMEGIPIKQEASASAYQILSYLSLDKEMAIQTNLIKDGKEPQIHDIYEILKQPLLQYACDILHLSIRNNKYLLYLLDSSLVKRIFMSRIYGKTVESTAADINTKLSTLKYQNCLVIAQLCFRFWREQYSHITNLETLIRLISSVVASARQPVWLSNQSFYTKQDYIRLRSNHIWVNYFDKKKRKRKICRKKITMKEFTNKRDRRKTVDNTFANFILQMHASIEIDMAHNASKQMPKPIPLYTVHEQFITTAKHSQYLPLTYREILVNQGPPLLHINKFIYDNVIVPVIKVSEPEIEMLDFYQIKEKKSGYTNKELPLVLENLELYLTEYIKIFIINDSNQEIPQSWNKMIRDIVNRYKSYANATYSYDNPRTGFNKKWMTFAKDIILERSDNCLHF